MLEGIEVLQLDLLNRATLAWVEGDYRAVSIARSAPPRETGCAMPRAWVGLRPA
jgi:hypothetical protein